MPDFTIATGPFPRSPRTAPDPERRPELLRRRHAKLAEDARVTAVPCSECGRPRGLCCTDERGVATRKPHPERVAAADALETVTEGGANDA